MQQRNEIPRWIVTAVLAVGGLLLAVNGWGQTAEDAQIESVVSALTQDARGIDQDAPEIDADAARRALNSAIQERRAFREVRRLAAPARISSAKPDAPQGMAQFRNAKEKAVNNDGAAQEKQVAPTASDVPAPQAKEAVAQEKPAPAATLADIKISFGPDPRHTQGSQAANNPASKVGYSTVDEGEVTVEARLEGHDAEGLPVAISAAWNPADPATVDVSPAEGNAVTITVRGAGQSNLTVAGPGFSKDLWISATAREGKAIQVDITQ